MVRDAKLAEGGKWMSVMQMEMQRSAKLHQAVNQRENGWKGMPCSLLYARYPYRQIRGVRT